MTSDQMEFIQPAAGFINASCTKLHILSQSWLDKDIDAALLV